MRRVLVALAVVAFVGVALVLARWLQTEGVERGAVEDLLAAQARGDAPAMLRELDGCGPGAACATLARGNAARLRRAGEVQVVAYDSATSHALSDTSGPTRVVWKTADSLTVVQCVLVRRRGSALAGLEVDLVRVSAPRPRTGGCR